MQNFHLFDRLAAISAMAAVVQLAACGSESVKVAVFESPAPNLSTTSRYVGKLTVVDGCLAVEMGGTVSGDTAQPATLALPLLNRGLRAVSEQGRTVIIAPDGSRFQLGETVTGEGAPYPLGDSSDSAPVPRLPDTGGCQGRPYQINSMHLLR